MKVKISSIVENQFPAFVREESPTLVEALKQYFISGEFPGGPFDLITNLDEYTKLENLVGIVKSTSLTADTSFYDDILNVTSTEGFPDSYGLIKIDSEIITYTSKTDHTFNGCIRGFSGISNDNLEFSPSEVNTHTSGAIVENLSVIFLEKFLDKIKKQLVPGFAGRDFSDSLNQTTFIERSKDFYSVKGTDRSFEILFQALYSEPVKVIKPRDYLFSASAADYRVSKDLVVELVTGDPQTLENRALFQDEVQGFKKATGSISKVEKINRGDKTYYIISLDYDYNKDIIVSGSVFGEFSIHPKTQITSSAISGATTLDVDSTVGFPASGSLLVNDQIIVDYTSKSLTQFFGCTGIISDISSGSTISFADQTTTNVNALGLAYGYGDNNQLVIVRVTGVINELKQINEVYHANVGDKIRPKSLGKLSTDIRTKNWFYNYPIKYNVDTVTLINPAIQQYRIQTIDSNMFIVGDSLNIVYTNGTIIKATVASKDNYKTFTIQNQGPISPNLIDHIERNITKVNSSKYPDTNVYAANVQNVYEDFSGNVFVASPSLPSYSNQSLDADSRKITFSGTSIGSTITFTNHGFLTGDVIVYDYPTNVGNLGIEKGTYYVKKVDENNFNLATSRAKLKASQFVGFNGTASQNTFSYNDFYNKSLQNQKLIRKISTPVSPKVSQETSIGNIGILNNGVEIVNYKSKDTVFYGPVQTIDIVSPGSNYDVINPPVIQVTDEIGSGLIANCVIKGSLKEIRIIDRGLNYVSEPTITITGGNGSGARAKAEISYFDHSVSFNSTSITNNVIGFSTYHGFNNGEKIIYKPDGLSRVLGITTDSEYFAAKIDESSVKLHKTYTDALSGINTVSITYNGFAIHRFVAYNAKPKISSITVVDPGTNYTNRKIAAPISGINTATNIININNHGFKTGEKLIYSGYTGTPISGLTTNTSYYVTALDENNFSLSALATSGISTSVDFYFKNNQYVNLSSAGIGTHYFSDEPIQVTLFGISGVGTTNSSIYTAKIQPIFRGEIDSVFIENGGQKYGQEDILNYNRQPTINLNSGQDANVQAIVSNGKIVQVLILNSGSGYNSPPDILISGTGRGAVLTPIVSNGQLTDVKIVDSGYDYDANNIVVTIIPAGSSGELRTNPKKWTINLVERLINTSKITGDDGIITNSLNSEYELQYTHGYAPRKYRQTLTVTKYVNDQLVYQPDLLLSNGKETLSDVHSPIIGWAYDGNPIYGPYGFDSTKGTVKLIKSGYEQILKDDRPNTTLYKEGSFIEDYTFTNSGDLDEKNGRYCITPDFPNGTYAYFSTLSGSVIADSTNPFNNYFRPVFPYLIGIAFNNQAIDFNFNRNSNQDNIDLNSTGWIRNTSPLSINAVNTTYGYLISPFNVYEQNATVTSTLPGQIESINVKNGGSGYKVGDKIVFKNEGTEGSNAFAQVISLQGKDINSISVASTSLFNVEFVANPQYGIIGFSSVPHNLLDKDIVSINNLNYNRTELQNTFKIGVESQKLILNADVNLVAFTGFNTYLNVYGNLNYPFIRENDVLQIDDEQIKVLNIDIPASRLFVERAYNGTVGSYHTIGAFLNELPRKFYINTNVQNLNNSVCNREIYFEPSQSLGIGAGSTVVFYSPGVGPTSIFIPTRSIYIPNHNLKTNDPLIYNLNGGSQITVSTDGVTVSALKDKTPVFAIRYTDNFIGLSTQQVGVGTTGIFVGYNTTSPAKILYYNVNATGKKHSLVTLYNSTKGQVNRNTVSIFTSQTPDVQPDDIISVQAYPQTTQTVSIFYNSATQRLVLNQRNFTAGAVDITNETIQIPKHNYFTGQKILYTATSPISGLSNNQIYYVVVITSDVISLARTYYDSTLDTPNIIGLNSATAGTIYEINSSIDLVRNNSLVFDLSDISLSFNDGLNVYPAFDFNLYTDSEFLNRFEVTPITNNLVVKKVGTIGVSTNASLTLTYDENLPSKLYYQLIPLKNKNVFVDTENVDNNVINFTDSLYSGSYSVAGVGSTSFTYNIKNYPESSGYTQNITYTTTSSNATGPIDSIKVTSGGTGYKTLPGISTIITSTGANAILDVNSTTIGRVNNVALNNIGFEYPSDLTLIPLTQTSVVLKVIPQTTLKTVKVIFPGIGYLTAPSLVLLDGLTLKQIKDVDLSYKLGDQEVTIIRNSKGINNVQPIIIPTNNSNAIGINSISFNSVTNDVVMVLDASYTNASDFPINVGDKILVENVSILSDPSAKGYNSSAYDYARFTVKAIDPKLNSTNPTVTYNLSNYLEYEEYPGTFDSFVSSGSIIPESFFPKFSIELTKNSFFINESISYQNKTGTVMFWNSENELLTISTADPFMVGEMIVGSDSLSQGVIDRITSFDSYYKIDSSSIVRKGWLNDKGFFDNQFQRLPDNDYYQAFAYSLKSKKDYSTWNNAVSSLNHIAGFKKFADLVVETANVSGIDTSQPDSEVDLIVSKDSTADFNCIVDYDLATENNYTIDPKLYSNQIYFNSVILQDYSECIGNRVLNIDNISSGFDGYNKQFDLTSKSKPIFKRVFDGSDSTIVNLQNNTISLNNHYFTNGEKVSYSYFDSPIGINTVSITGIGSTNVLPSTVYVVKYNESTIGFSTSAADALSVVPNLITFTNVGVGSTHSFTAFNQNSRALISLGGVIQSPVSSTATTAKLNAYVGIASTVILVSPASNFASGDCLKVDDEIMKVMSVGLAATNDVNVQRAWAGTGIATHQINSTVYRIQGDYNIIDSTIYFVDPPKGPSPIGTTTGSSEEVDFTGITTTLDFTGRVFMRNGVIASQNDAYSTNYVFDDISHNFNGISSTFTLQSNFKNVTGFANSNAVILVNEVLQSPSDFVGDYKTFGSYSLQEQSGITSAIFLGNPTSQTYNANSSSLPVGGVIVSIGYTQGLGLQPLVCAGGTAIVSAAGTIRSISIGNSGSGYRSGLQVVNVGIYVSTTGITTTKNIGVASVLNGNVVSVAITNPGTGYTFTNPPLVKFDDPYPYKNLSLNYVPPSSGIGTGAKVNITVSMGSSILDLEVVNKGFAYKKGDILSVSIGGTVGIPTIANSTYVQPNISVTDIYNNKFSGWTIGELQIIDSIEPLFNGFRKVFPLKMDNQYKNIRARYGSPIDIKTTLLVFINGILQIPGEGYTFTGSSYIKFSEAPREGFSCLIMFYRGSGATDVVDVDIIEPVKAGDTLQLVDEKDLTEYERFITKINTSDSVITLPYSEQGVSPDEAYIRPVTWCKQKEDLFVNRQVITKNRQIYEPLVEPTSNIIKTVGINSTMIFVESAKTFFDDQRENALSDYTNKLRIVTQDLIRPAIASANISIAGTVSSVTILDGGVGYTTTPVISFSTPLGLTTSSSAYGKAVVTSGSVTSVNITSPGTGYTATQPPQVLISNPTNLFENITASTIKGDFGLICGIKTTTVGVAPTGLVFSFFIPTDSTLRSAPIAGAAITVSGIQTGYYFVTKNTFVGNGVTSLDENGSTISIGSSYIDNVYRVANVSLAQTTVSGVGKTTVANVTVSVTDNNISNLGFTTFYGTYSWGLISLNYRTAKNQFVVYNNGLPGIDTSPIVKRINPLKYQNYT